MSHFQGIVLSIMLFLAGFVIYPIAAALGGGYQEEFVTIRVASAIYTALQALVIITWAFYTAFHACCNSVSLSRIPKHSRDHIDYVQIFCTDYTCERRSFKDGNKSFK